MIQDGGKQTEKKTERGRKSPTERQSDHQPEEFATIAAVLSSEERPFSDDPTLELLKGITAMDLAVLTIEMDCADDPDGPMKAIRLLQRCQNALNKGCAAFEFLVPYYEQSYVYRLKQFESITGSAFPKWPEEVPREDLLKALNLKPLQIEGKSTSGEALCDAWFRETSKGRQGPKFDLSKPKWRRADAIAASLHFAQWRAKRTKDNLSKKKGNLIQNKKTASSKKNRK